MKKTILLLALAITGLFKAQTTQLNSAYCNYTSISPSEFIWADSIGSPTTDSFSRYKFKFESGSTTFTWQTNNEYPIFEFGLMPAASFTYNTHYIVSVAYSSDFGSTFGTYGSTCTLTSPVNATTQLSTGYCGSTPSSFTQIINADYIQGATQYEYQLVNSALSYSQTFTKTNNNFILNQFTGLANSTTYSVNIRTFIFNAWDVWGPVCTITTPSAQPTTQLSSGYCPYSPATISTIIFADGVGGATQYEYRLINSTLSYIQSFAKTNNNFVLGQFTGLTNSATYSVSIRVMVNSIWGPYGSSCNVTVPAAPPTTSLSTGYCGYTSPTYNTIINADYVSSATQYEYRLRNSSLSYTQTFAKFNNNFVLSQFTGLSNSTTYSVDVRVFANSAWGSFGTICSVTTPSTLPTTSLQASQCGVTATSYTNQVFFCGAIGGATHYKYKLENTSLSYIQEYEKTNNNFILNQFTGLQNNTTYTVTVKVEYQGNYGIYDAACTITTPATFMRIIKDVNGNTYNTEFENLDPGFYIITENGKRKKVIKQ